MSDAPEPLSQAKEEDSNLSAVLTTAGFILGATALWVGLALTTDRTYHLAPVIIAAVPGVLARASERDIPWPLAVIPGLIAVAIGWAVIVAADAEPTTTLIEEQWGGVTGEVIAGAVIGAVGGLIVSRTRSAGRPAR
jgi:hypothetical protein